MTWPVTEPRRAWIVCALMAPPSRPPWPEQGRVEAGPEPIDLRTSITDFDQRFRVTLVEGSAGVPRDVGERRRGRRPCGHTHVGALPAAGPHSDLIHNEYRPGASAALWVALPHLRTGSQPGRTSGSWVGWTQRLSDDQCVPCYR